MARTRDLKIFNNQYIVRAKLSSGSFGVVFSGEDKLTQSEVALKVEKEENEENRTLDREVTAQFNFSSQALYLSRLQGLQGIPKMFWHGVEGQYSVLVIQLLGKDLAHYVKTHKRLSLKTVLQLGDRLITTLEQVHNRSIIHRDLKPENILVGKGIALDQIYLVDFGISKFFRDPQGIHIAFKEGKPFIGTTRYASVAAHKGHELGRADDLESLAYVLIYLYKGVLPWQNMQNVSDKDKTKAVGQMKQKMEFSQLCKDMPQEFVRFLEYVRQLNFKSQPDYKYLRQLFAKAGQSSDIIFDDRYDWMEQEKKMSETKSSPTYQPESNNPKQPSELGMKSENQLPRLTDSKRDTKRNSIQVPDPGQGSQFDFLRPPDPYAKGRALIQRSQERHKSVQSNSQYSKNSFQFSVMNQYQPSMLEGVISKPTTPQSNVDKHKAIENSMLDLRLGETVGAFQLMDSIEEIDFDLRDEPLIEKYHLLIEKEVRAEFKQRLVKIYKGEHN